METDKLPLIVSDGMELSNRFSEEELNSLGYLFWNKVVAVFDHNIKNDKKRSYSSAFKNLVAGLTSIVSENDETELGSGVTGELLARDVAANLFLKEAVKVEQEDDKYYVVREGLDKIDYDIFLYIKFNFINHHYLDIEHGEEVMPEVTKTMMTIVDPEFGVLKLSEDTLEEVVGLLGNQFDYTVLHDDYFSKYVRAMSQGIVDEMASMIAAGESWKNFLFRSK